MIPNGIRYNRFRNDRYILTNGRTNDVQNLVRSSEENNLRQCIEKTGQKIKIPNAILRGRRMGILKTPKGPRIFGNGFGRHRR